MARNIINEVFTVMLTNSTYINKTNKYLSPQTIEQQQQKNRQLFMSLDINGRENRRGNQE
jgi:hypothetical protein